MNINKRFWLFAIVIAMTLLAISLLTLQIGCKKEDEKITGLSIVGDFWYRMEDGAHDDPLQVTDTSIAVVAEILDDGGLSVTERGVCWGTVINPTISENKTSDGTGTGKFTSHISGLSPTVNYFIRAYATNSLGTAYGPCLPVHTFSGTMTDVDSNIYNRIIIGTQEWMAENLRTTKLNDGTPIYFETNMNMWPTRTIPEYCYYQNDSTYKEVYGALYNGYAVKSGKLCPSGWHLPSYSEWTTLIKFLGDSLSAGAKMKRPGTHVWDGENKDATNESGFTALPGGFLTDNAGCGGEWDFSGQLTGAGWWSDTPGTNDSLRYAPYLLASSSAVFRSYPALELGLSVRCLKD